MSTQKFPPPLSSTAVLELAQLQGLPVEDEAMAERLAAGAHAAAMAVRAASAAWDPALLCEREPSEYLALLEQLADVTPGTST